MYRSGPRTEPWGIPKGAWTQADLEEPNVTQFVRSERKERSHSSGLSVRPKVVERHWRRILLSTESNAELTSKRANSETCPASMALWRSDRRRTKRVFEWYTFQWTKTNLNVKLLKVLDDYHNIIQYNTIVVY